MPVLAWNLKKFRNFQNFLPFSLQFDWKTIQLTDWGRVNNPIWFFKNKYQSCHPSNLKPLFFLQSCHPCPTTTKFSQTIKFFFTAVKKSRVLSKLDFSFKLLSLFNSSSLRRVKDESRIMIFIYISWRR